MTEKILISGLCINCLNADQCSYCVNQVKPIIFCEEFSCTEPSEQKNISSEVSKKVDYNRHSVLKGICINCENAEICNLQKTGSNVLYCEEYR